MIKKKKPIKINKEKMACSIIQEQELKTSCILEKTFSILSMLSFAALVFAILFFLFGCTNVVMTHTEGTGASETLDEAQTTSPNVSPTVNIPVKP